LPVGWDMPCRPTAMDYAKTSCRRYTLSGGTRQNDRRVVRGGSWNNNPRNLRSANRNRNNTDEANNNLGFRVASTPANWPEPDDSRIVRACSGCPHRPCLPAAQDGQTKSLPGPVGGSLNMRWGCRLFFLLLLNFLGGWVHAGNND